MMKILIALYIAATSGALIALKLGSKAGAPLHLADGRLQLNINLWAMSGIFLYGFSFLMYMYLISKYDLGYIVPLVTGFVYVVVFLASFMVFKEAFTAVKIAGIVLILAGIILLNLKS